jgi:4-cresol dehydrogenase (hydroxylating)
LEKPVNSPVETPALSSGFETWQDLSGCSREVGGVFRPRSRDEVLEIIRSSQRDGVKLHAISCGRNWGFGSRLPVAPKAVVLDLSGLRAIRKLDLEQDYVELEPGVTQGDLHDALTRAGGSHYFNVTGAGRSTSMIGNGLERGIGYFGSKKDDLLDLEIALGNGEVVWSKGQGGNPHHPGLGPDLTGLFQQSGWGVVIGARMRLRKKPPYMAAILAQLAPTASFVFYLDAIAQLAKEGLIHSVPHIASRERMVSTFGPYLPAEAIRQFAAAAPEWSALIPVGGSREMVEALFALVRARMEGIAQCRLIDEESCAKEPHLVPALDLALGRPNDFALPSVGYAALPGAPIYKGDLDAGRAGLVHVTPTAPAQGTAVARLLGAIDETRAAFGFAPLAMTLNLVNAGTVAVIISIPFDRENPAGAANAHALARALHGQCGELGFTPYRLGLEDAPDLPSMPAPRARLLRGLGRLADPNAVLAPSRYSAWWSEAAADSSPGQSHPSVEATI